MSIINLDSIPPESIAQCNLLHSLTVPKDLIEKGCRIVVPLGDHKQVKTNSANKRRACTPQMELCALMQFASGPVYFNFSDREQEDSIFDLYPNLNRGAIVRNLSADPLFFLPSPESGNVQCAIQPDGSGSLPMGTWMVISGLDKTLAIIIRVIDIFSTPEQDQRLVNRNEILDFNHRAAYQPFTYTYDRHIAGHNWQNPTKSSRSNIVYQGTHSEKGLVVVKTMLKPDMAPPEHVTQARLYRREITMHSKLSHQSILTMFGSDSRCLTIFLEHVPGQDLVHSFSKLCSSDIINIWMSMSDALAYLHGLNMVHCDVKPDNILWDGGRALLCDFGMTTVMPVYRGGGTPWYLAPEFWGGSEFRDGLSDVWALGITMLWLRGHIDLPHRMVGGWNIHVAKDVINSVDNQRSREWRLVVETKQKEITSVDPLIAQMIDPVRTKRPSASEIVQLLKCSAPKDDARSIMDSRMENVFDTTAAPHQRPTIQASPTEEDSFSVEAALEKGQGAPVANTIVQNAPPSFSDSFRAALEFSCQAAYEIGMGGVRRRSENAINVALENDQGTEVIPNTSFKISDYFTPPRKGGSSLCSSDTIIPETSFGIRKGGSVEKTTIPVAESVRIGESVHGGLGEDGSISGTVIPNTPMRNEDSFIGTGQTIIPDTPVVVADTFMEDVENTQGASSVGTVVPESSLAVNDSFKAARAHVPPPPRRRTAARRSRRIADLNVRRSKRLAAKRA